VKQCGGRAHQKVNPGLEGGIIGLRHQADFAQGGAQAEIARAMRDLSDD
jgi:hypothetical protein